MFEGYHKICFCFIFASLLLDTLFCLYMYILYFWTMKCSFLNFSAFPVLFASKEGVCCESVAVHDSSHTAIEQNYNAVSRLSDIASTLETVILAPILRLRSRGVGGDKP